MGIGAEELGKGLKESRLCLVFLSLVCLVPGLAVGASQSGSPREESRMCPEGPFVFLSLELIGGLAFDIDGRD